MENQIAEIVTTYADMKSWRDAFFRENGAKFLIVIGSPGIAKTRLFVEHADDDLHHLSGQLSALQLYMDLHQNLDKPLVIDDVDSLFQDKAAINLLKNLCSTEDVKTVFWGKRNPELDKLKIPRRFQTCSRVCILANTLANVEANLRAVLDRAIVIRFQPTVAEVHREVGTWFTDGEIHDFIGKHLSLVSEPSMRTYVKALELKRLGRDWQGWLLRQWTGNDPKLAIVSQIMTDPRLTTSADRVARFVEMGGGSRATYMRKQAEWKNLRSDEQKLQEVGSQVQIVETLRPVPLVTMLSESKKQQPACLPNSHCS